MNALAVQCGGPTAVINTSLAALMEGWQRAGGTIYGALMGTQGLAEGRFVMMPALDSAALARLAEQPGAALGSGRYSLTDGTFAAALEHLERARIDTLFLMGGNGTMSVAQRLARAAPHLQVLGVPKTVDNDLAGVDVAPGYGSAARYTAASVREAMLDLRAMANFDQVVILEAMGRHTGWIAASAALARCTVGDGPHLILLPEAPVDEEELLARIVETQRAEGLCLVVAAEGTCDREGLFLAEKLGDGGSDDRGQRVLSMASGVAAYLGQRVQKELGLRCRQLRPNTLQRASRALVSMVDRELAWKVGTYAVELALRGSTGVMVGLRRTAAARWAALPVPLEEVVGHERLLPAAMLDPAHYDVTDHFLDYLLPVVGDLGPVPQLWM